MRKPEKRSWAASLVAVATTAALFFVGWHAVRFGLADYARVQSNQRLVLWEAHRINLSPRNLNAIEAWASVSASLAPEISDTYEILGTVSFIRAARPWRDETERVEDLRRAAAQYREAAERFRVSGYAWGNLMLAKHHAGDFDAEFLVAMRNALRFAPHEPLVQLMLVETGLGNWERLPAYMRNQVARSLANLWDRYPESVLVRAMTLTNRSAWCGGLPARDVRGGPFLWTLCGEVAKGFAAVH